MSESRHRRRRARPCTAESHETVPAAQTPAVSPLAAFLDDAEAALSELRESDDAKDPAVDSNA